MNTPREAFPNGPYRLKGNTAVAFAPYRVSLVGGGTDLPEFFEHQRGSVVSFSMTIGVHVFASLSRQQRHNILTCDECYSGTDIGMIQNRLLRESLRLTSKNRFVKLAALGDLAHGSGMGSSGTFAVSILLALSYMFDNALSARELAETAYSIERHKLKEKVGKQDQYAAALGGLNHISFSGDDVDVKPISITGSNIQYLQDNMLLLATGNRRKAGTILREMSLKMHKRTQSLLEMRNLADDLACLLAKSDFDVSEIGQILNLNWQLKRSLSRQISNSAIDTMHEIASANGAMGAKLLGAGSGGYMLILAPPERHQRIKEALGNPEQQPCKIRSAGATLVEPEVQSSQAHVSEFSAGR